MSSTNDSNASGPVWSMLRKKQLIPKCCAKHIVPCYISKAVDISSWNFPVPGERFTLVVGDEDDESISQEVEVEKPDLLQQIVVKKSKDKHKFGRYSKLTKLHQQQLKDMKQFEQHLEQGRIKSSLDHFQSSLEPAMFERVARLLNISVPAADEKEAKEEEEHHESETATVHSSPPLSAQISEESTAPVEVERHSPLSSSSVESTSQNPYKNLLKRLAQEEYEKKHPDKDKVEAKVLGEHIQKVTNAFSNWTTTIGIKDANKETEEERIPIIEAKALQKMFKVKYGQTPLCPHIPVGVREPKFDPRIPEDELGKLKKPEPEGQDRKMKYNVKWYLDPEVWFQDWTKDDIKQKIASKGKSISPSSTAMSYRDNQLMNLHGVQAFLRYLDENNLSPPNFLKSNAAD